jgi:type IV secretory pathway VirB2 component (pilin)
MGRLALSTAALRPLMPPAAGWARAAQTPVMPWDPTLYAVVDYLTGPALHAIAWLALIAAALDYALGGKLDGGVVRLFRMGVGLLLALHAVQIMNFLFG